MPKVPHTNKQGSDAFVDKSAYQEESTHLKETYKRIHKEYTVYKKQVKKLEKYYEEGLKSAAKEGKLDDAIETLKSMNYTFENRSYRFLKEFVKRLEKQLVTPYFARIDFSPTGVASERSDGGDSGFSIKSFGTNILNIYIGKHAFFHTDSEFQVMDWRSPIASLYYNYTEPTDNAVYEFPVDVEGKPWVKEVRKVNGNLILRRNIEVDHDNLLAIYDNSLRIDLLTSELNKKSGGALEDIVRTIQKEQDEIIRSDPNKICVVQGTAGSGKTTVAIHRMSYLFYTYKDYITEHNTLLLSSSKVLVNYVAQTLPELEIYSLARNTLTSFIRKSLADFGYEIDSRRTFNHKDKYSKFKNSPEFIEGLKRFVEDKKKWVREEIERIPQYDELSMGRYFVRYDVRAPYDIIDGMIEGYSDDADAYTEEYKQGNPAVLKRLRNVNSAVERLQKIMWLFDPVKFYGEFLRSTYVPDAFAIKFDKNKLSVDDMSAIYYIAHKLRGVTPYKDFKHVVVDEGQDLGILNYLVINTFVRGNGFTILGDLNQATEDNGSLKSWKELELIWDSKDIDYYNIKVSYRTTKEIITFARRILEKFSDFTYLPEPFDRSGENPVVEVFLTRDAMLDKVVNEVMNMRLAGDLRAVGIIEPNDAVVKETYEILNKKFKDVESDLDKDSRFDLVLVDRFFDEFSNSGVFLIPGNLVKGLEFNSVFILDANSKLYGKDPLSAKKLFVFATRAINRLYVYGVGEVNGLFR